MDSKTPSDYAKIDPKFPTFSTSGTYESLGGTMSWSCIVSDNLVSFPTDFFYFSSV